MGKRGSVSGLAHHASAAVSSPACIGRVRELSALTDALSRPAVLVLVEGEAGIGKSRLVQEFFVTPTGLEHRVLVGVCPPVREPFTLGSIVDAVRQAYDRLDSVQLSPLAGALRPLFPEWELDLPATPESLEDATAARHRLFRALAELLGTLGITLLVLEDMHWADDASLEFLLFLMSRRPRTLSVMVTYRPQEVPDESLLLRLSARAPDGAGKVRIELKPLDVADTARMVSSMLGDEQVSDAFAAFLHERTAGVPLAVEESVRLLHDRSDLAKVGDEWVRRSLTELQVPPTVRDSVLERLQRLGAPAQQVLRAVAVMGETVDEQAIPEVSGLPPEQAHAGIAEAVASGLLTEGRIGRLRFRHILASRAVYEALPGPDRRALHQRAGQSLERAGRPSLAQLARHYREAGQAAQWSYYAERAADLAIQSGDDRTAFALLIDLLGAADLSAEDLARGAKKLAVAASARRMPFDALIYQVIDALRTALRAPGLSPQDRAAIRSPLGRLLIQTGDYEEGYAELETAIADLGHDPIEAARTMSYLAWPFASPWPISVHLDWLERASRLSLDAGSPLDRLVLMIDRVSALLQLGEESGWALAATLPDQADGEAERQQVARGQLNVGWAAMRWGRYAEAGRRLVTCLSIADANADARIRWYVVAAQAHLDWFSGSWAGLTERVAAVVGSQEASPANQVEAVLISGLVDAATGSRRRAEDQLRQVLAEARRRGGLDMLVEPAAALARLYVSEARAEDALRVTDEAMSTVAEKGIWLWAVDIARVRVEALTACGRSAEAGDLATAYEDWLRGRDVPAGFAAAVQCRATLTAAQGNHLKAAAMFEEAADRWDELPRPYDALLAREAEARCLLSAGRPELGIPLLSTIFDSLSALGARRDADRLVPVLRAHGQEIRRAQRGGRRAYGERLSPQELEVTGLVAAGHTNRQIAAALVLSPKTVARHLDSAMHKLGVSSRTALAVTAVAIGLVSDPAQQHPTGR